MAELSITNFGIGAGFGGGGNPPSTGNMGLSLGGFNQVNNSIQNQSLGSMSFINPNFDFSPTTQPSMGGSIQIGNIGGATQIDDLNLLKPPTFTFPSLTIPPPPKPVIYEPPVETTPISAFSTEFADRGLNAVSQLKTFKIIQKNYGVYLYLLKALLNFIEPKIFSSLDHFKHDFANLKS